jgi:hypothetical protein
VLDSLEAVLLQPFGVLCVQQSPGNSAGPEVDIGAPAPLVRDGLLDRHVRDLQAAPGDKDAIVAVCGKCDTALAPSNKLIRAEADQAKGLPHICRNRTGTGLEQRRDDEQPVVTSSPVGPLTDAAPGGLSWGVRRGRGTR